jgi:hypothetical protein
MGPGKSESADRIEQEHLAENRHSASIGIYRPDPKNLLTVFVTVLGLAQLRKLL